jgi:glycogen synthase
MDELLLVVRNRWTADDQKNYRAIIKTLPKLIRNAAKNGWKPQFIIGPFGNRRTPAWTKLRRKLRNLARRHRKQIFFENPDSKELILPKWGGLLKAADAQLVPSRYEPCGINHAQGMMYGTPPVCSKAGAMGEPPVNASNSFQFVWDDRTTKRSTDRFYKALLSTCDIYYSNRHLWKRMQKNAQRASLHYDWSRLAPQYAKLFR